MFRDLDAAFATLKPETVASLFTTKPQGVLLPTVSDIIRNTPEEVGGGQRVSSRRTRNDVLLPRFTSPLVAFLQLLDYFVSFLRREPRVALDVIPGVSPNVAQPAPNVIVNSGERTPTTLPKRGHDLCMHHSRVASSAQARGL